MEVRACKAFEIPKELLLQKKIWNLAEFYRQAVTATHWHGFVFSERGQDIAAVILCEDALASALVSQTVIVDKAHRTHETLTKVLRAGHQIMHELAQSLGLEWLCYSIRTPEKYLEMMGNPEGAEIIESVVREPVRK